VAHDNSDGAGLGLAIAARAVEVHRGKISASNAPGGGLSVELELPANSGVAK
jgi:signal transduction histidine kinase